MKTGEVEKMGMTEASRVRYLSWKLYVFLCEYEREKSFTLNKPS